MSIKESALNIAYSYLLTLNSSRDISRAREVLFDICNSNRENFDLENNNEIVYRETQRLLSVINEKESIRKTKGVYYTPSDVVDFITKNCFFLAYNESELIDMSKDHYKIFPCENVCKEKIVFDPTCGAGEFLLSALRIKYDIWERNNEDISRDDIENIVSTIRGNDINEESIVITKLRIYLMSIHRYGIEKCEGLGNVMNKCFSTRDYITEPPSQGNDYDIVIGNPPYVEDRKSGLDLLERYGNIYANVLINAANNLKDGGVFGFIIPLSYVSTPRMQKLRDRLIQLVPEQYIMNFSDRPDCLFVSVHQKLSILISKKTNKSPRIYTGNYLYWYKEERENLFSTIKTIENKYIEDAYIPKLGNENDIAIYKKVVSKQRESSLADFSDDGDEFVYVNMRATFWIKAFRKQHKGSEYKIFSFNTKGKADFYFCLMNSSLFWWFWVTVSDCWHITKKELLAFRVPAVETYKKASELAKKLEDKLEDTKQYVGTVQTDYEYKHKFCISEILEIDDYINSVFGLSETESDYIKKFAFNYRISGGVLK